MMSMTLNPMAVTPSFGMPACGHTSTGVAHEAAWTIPATGASAEAFAARTRVLIEGQVADFGKRGYTTGTYAWRPSDC